MFDIIILGDKMKAIKNILAIIISISIIVFIYSKHDTITKFIMVNFIYKDDIIIQKDNSYKRGYDWHYVKRTNDFTPHNKQDILNIFYTALDDGWDELTFYCPDDYISCLKDVRDITEDDYTLSNINNFVQTFNSYNTIYVNINNFGRIHIEIEKLYNQEEIQLVTKKIDEIYNQIIHQNMTDTQKIKAVHDYIIHHTVYDQARAKTVIDRTSTDFKHPSNLALGPLVNGKAICGGYADTMALFLDKMNIKNYKVASTSHIWNLVYIDGTWKHLDLTWDDPVVNTGENVLLYDYFLISYEQLKNQNNAQHNFNTDIYQEGK